jgi:hypothetical protein
MNKLLCVFAALFVAVQANQALAQATQSTSQTSTGTTNRLSVTISNTNGVSSSATMTPNFDVYTSAKLIVGPDSTSYQEITDPAASLSNTGNTAGSTSSSASGTAQGASSIGNIKYGDGTAYEVKITPKDVDGQARDSYSTAQGSASGNVTTQILIDSTSSSFVNTFLSSF